jgi:hypothetical protein
MVGPQPCHGCLTEALACPPSHSGDVGAAVAFPGCGQPRPTPFAPPDPAWRLSPGRAMAPRRIPAARNVEDLHGVVIAQGTRCAGMNGTMTADRW